MSVLSRSFIVAMLSVTTLGSVLRAEQAGGYAVTATWNVGGEGRWDYVLVEGGRLYVTRSNHELVLDVTSGKTLADIKVGQHLHGTAIVPSLNRAFITDGKLNSVYVIDLKTNAPLGRLDAADDADGIIYDAGADRVLVGCGDAGQLVVIDPKADLAKNKVDKITLGGKAEYIAADGQGRAFVCLNDKNQIAVVDLKSLKVLDHWAIGAGATPTGLAIDAKGGHLFVGCRNEKLIVMSASTGKVEAELPIGKNNDACAFDPGTGEAFASCGDGTLTVVGQSNGAWSVKQTVKTLTGARTMALDPTTHMIYLPTADTAKAKQGERPAPIPGSFAIVVVSPAKAK